MTPSNPVSTCEKFNRADRQTELVRDSRTFKWCTKDCHKKPQWCARPVCRSKADHKKWVEEKKGNPTISNDFKVALSAIVTDEDYKALESQFFGKAGN